MKTTLLLSSLLLSSVVGIYGSDGVVAGQNETAARAQPAGAQVSVARSETTTDPTLSFVYREQQAFTVDAIQATFADQRDWQAIDFGTGGRRNETAAVFGQVLRHQAHLKTLRIVKTQFNLDALEALVRNIGACPLETLNLR